MILIIELDLDMVMQNRHAGHVDQNSFRWKVIVRTHLHLTECSTWTTKVVGSNDRHVGGRWLTVKNGATGKRIVRSQLALISYSLPLSSLRFHVCCCLLDLPVLTTGIVFSRIGLKLMDTPRTSFGGLGLSLKEWFEALASRRSIASLAKANKICPRGVLEFEANFELEDTSRTNFVGLGLGLEDPVLEHMPG